jgi:hypothetical protein
MVPMDRSSVRGQKGLRFGGLVLSALAAALVAAPPAQAAFHFMVIQEVFVGPPSDGILRPVPLTADQKAQYVMLRMTSNGQNFVNGTSIRVEDANGNILGTFGTFTANPANGGGACAYPSCPAVIIGTQAAKNLFTFAFDKIVDGQAGRVALPPSGGRVCFVSGTSVVDCVAWGNFNCTVSGACATANGLRTGEFSANGCDTNWGTNAPALVYGKVLEHGAAFNCAAKANSTDYSSLFPKPVNNAGNNNNVDGDNDGLIDQLDCNDAATSLLWPVTEVQKDTVSFVNRSLVQWDSQAAVSGSGVIYDVAKGTAANRVNYTDASCLVLHTANSSVMDPAVLPPGGAFYYVVKAEGCNTSTWGAGVTATSRDTALNPICP